MRAARNASVVAVGHRAGQGQTRGVGVPPCSSRLPGPGALSHLHVSHCPSSPRPTTQPRTSLPSRLHSKHLPDSRTAGRLGPQWSGVPHMLLPRELLPGTVSFDEENDARAPWGQRAAGCREGEGHRECPHTLPSPLGSHRSPGELPEHPPDAAEVPWACFRENAHPS